MARNMLFSYSLVGIQMLCVGLLLLTTPFTNLKVLELLFIIIGGTLGLWAALTMREVSKFQILPDVNKNASLVQTGPYKYIRHPMYAGLLVACLGLFLFDMSVLRTILYLVLCVDLYVKMRYEERLLLGQFPDYGKYSLQTRRLIPFVY